jgi:hypothetical protein
VHPWLPQTSDLDPDPNTTYLPQMEDPNAITTGLAVFLARYPRRDTHPADISWPMSMPSAASKPFRNIDRHRRPATASPRRKTVPGAVQPARLTVKLPTISAAVCALLQTRADYAALREPFYLSKLILPAESGARTYGAPEILGSRRAVSYV